MFCWDRKPYGAKPNSNWLSCFLRIRKMVQKLSNNNSKNHEIKDVADQRDDELAR